MFNWLAMFRRWIAAPYPEPEKEEPMGFSLGKKSKAELIGVHPDLIAVVERAIEITKQDFTVFDGIRSPMEQNALYRRKASQLDGYKKKSKHQRQPDGYGHAVDLVPYIDGKPRWEWGAIWPIAAAMAQAAFELNVRIRWGGYWGELNIPGADRPRSATAIKERQRKYRGRFPDGPHYELLP